MACATLAPMSLGAVSTRTVSTIFAPAIAESTPSPIATASWAFPVQRGHPRSFPGFSDPRDSGWGRGDTRCALASGLARGLTTREACATDDFAAPQTIVKRQGMPCFLRCARGACAYLLFFPGGASVTQDSAVVISLEDLGGLGAGAETLTVGERSRDPGNRVESICVKRPPPCSPSIQTCIWAHWLSTRHR